MRAKPLLETTLAICFLFLISLSAQNIQYNTLGTWNNRGVPNYLEPDNDLLGQGFISRLRASLKGGQRVPVVHPEYLSDEVKTNLYVTETCEVWVTFVDEGAGYKNALGFYTYDAASPPQSISDIESTMTLIFPNSSKKYSGGGLVPGNKVKIGTFQQGTVIGWFLVANGYRNGNVGNGNWLLFSDKNLNPESNPSKRQHNIQLKDDITNRVLITFEDIRRDYGSCDEDFEDAIFFATANPTNAINYDGIVQIENPNPDNYANISLAKIVNNNNPNDGDQITYTITAENLGPDNATNIKITDDLPEGLVYVSSAASAGSYDVNTGIWLIPTLSNGNSATLDITAEVTIENISQAAFDLGAAFDYNLFLFDDLEQPSSDTEGKVAVGGDAYLSNYSIGDRLPPSGGSEDVFIVGGNLTYLSGTVTGGNVVYGIGTNLPDDAVSIIDGTIRQDNIIDFDAAQSHLISLSNSLTDYTPNGTVTFENNGLNLVGSDPFLNVFDVEGPDVTAATSFTVSAPNGSVVLINVSGESVEWGGALTILGTAISNVLYNFNDAQYIKIQGIDVRGTILAPYALVEFPSGVVNGQVIANSVEGVGQFNSGDLNVTHFRGMIPVSETILNSTEVLELDQIDEIENNNSAEIEITIAGYSNPGNTGNVNWQLTGNFGNDEIVWDMVFDANGNIITGNWGGKIYRSTDQGTTWTHLNPNMNVNFIWDLEIIGTDIFAGTDDGIYKSTDDGATWVSFGLSSLDVRGIAGKNNILFAGTWGSGIYKTDLSNVSWITVNNGLSSLLIQSLAVNSKGDLFAGSFGDGIFKSINDGTDWVKLNIASQFVWTIAIDTQDRIYCGTYGNGIFRSIDDGSTWFNINGNLTATHVYSISIDQSSRVYLSSWTGGVYIFNPGKLESTDETWGSLGMNGLKVSSVLISPDNSVLYAGTNQGGFYANTSPLVSVESEHVTLPNKFRLEQNFPNPFNPTTKIQFSIPESGFVRLEIWDMLGRRVKTLIESNLSAGKHEVEFNASELSSGMYIYKLSSDKFVSSKKLLLLK